MAARDEDIPRYAYPLAASAGLFALPFVYALANFAAGGPLVRVGEGGHLGTTAAVFAAAHAALGAAFGLLWPERTWRWGVWLCGLPTCLASFVGPDAEIFLAWAAATLLPACAGALAAGRLHLKYAEVK